ncbi:hypothetical protein DFH11DRAFT_1743851 [Phellopilus nigrolimitatus]|nr:hypothetical protein DFH11DRAFT_1743851 [Phellopilus nigrolimitatus]
MRLLGSPIAMAPCRGGLRIVKEDSEKEGRDALCADPDAAVLRRSSASGPFEKAALPSPRANCRFALSEIFVDTYIGFRTRLQITFSYFFAILERNTTTPPVEKGYAHIRLQKTLSKKKKKKKKTNKNQGGTGRRMPLRPSAAIHASLVRRFLPPFRLLFHIHISILLVWPTPYLDSERKLNPVAASASASASASSCAAAPLELKSIELPGTAGIRQHQQQQLRTRTPAAPRDRPGSPRTRAYTTILPKRPGAPAFRTWCAMATARGGPARFVLIRVPCAPTCMARAAAPGKK